MNEEFHRNQSLLFIEWNWCPGCKYCWKYATQYPCLECLAKSIGCNSPLYFEKEISNE